MSSYGALHDWSMLLHYRMDFPDWLLSDDIAFSPESPAMLYQYPVAAYAFLRGYVKSGSVVRRNSIPNVFDIDRIQGRETEYTSNPGHHAGYLSVGEHALVGRCENVYGVGKSFQADITPFRSVDGETVRSITGELEWHGGPSPLLTVNAPKIRGLSGQVECDVLDFAGIRIHVEPGTRASIFLISLDDRDLEESKSMLLSVIGPVSLVRRGDLVRSERVDRDGGPFYEVSQAGRLPIVMKQVSGVVEFGQPVKCACELSISGTRKSVATFDKHQRKVPFSNHRSIWYQIDRE